MKAGGLRKVEAMTEVTDIVGIMRRRGWTAGATLLQHWMDYPSNASAALGVPDFSAVTVGWTLGFSRAAKVYDAAIRDKIWTTPDAKQRLRAAIQRRFPDAWNRPPTFFIDNPRATNPDRLTATNRSDIHDDRVAYASMTDGTTLDALTAALGRFGYYFSVSGSCARQGNGLAVHVDRVGIYIHDSFDFNNRQFLGFWDVQQGYVGKSPVHCWEQPVTGRVSQIFGGPPIPYEPLVVIPVPHCSTATMMTNGDFRDYRANTGMGSDFYVCSDIVYIDTNDYFLL